jgi:hypothetical protein
MLNQCLENAGEGLLHACISSSNVFSNPKSSCKISSTDIEMLVSSRIMQIIVFAGFLMALYKNCQIIWKPDKLQSHKIGLGVICLLDIELDVTVHKSFV